MFATIDYPIGHAIVIDNGGSLSDLASQFVERLSIISMPDNLGVPTAWNLGIQLTPHSEYWLMSQDDVQWVPGGLAKVASQSRKDVLTMDMLGPRPFSSFTVGRDVVRTVGMFDESYFPLGGDDSNFHKRCHKHMILERDIAGTFIAEKSASIKSLVSEGTTCGAVILLNMHRSIYGDVDHEGWTLDRRRKNSKRETRPEVTDRVMAMLDGQYQVHNKWEQAFMGPGNIDDLHGI